MAPKGKKDEPPPAPLTQGPEFAFPEWSEAGLAALQLDAVAPFEDEAFDQLPAPLAGVVATWKRPSEFVGELQPGADEATVLCVIDETSKHRQLPHLLQPVSATTASSGEEATMRCVAWLTSCYQMAALQADQLESGTFLWELIYPKAADGGLPAHSAAGKYAVKLFDQGMWRIVVVDDRMPFSASGAAMFPRSASALELWPLILAKALFKLSAATPAALTGDLAVLLRLTGWLPQTAPISDLLPATHAWDFLQASTYSKPRHLHELAQLRALHVICPTQSLIQTIVQAWP